MYDSFGNFNNSACGAMPYRMYGANAPMMSNIVKVSGINGVNALNVAANQQIVAFDETQNVMWFISTDSAGYKTPTAYDFVPHVDKAEVERINLESRIKRLEEIVNERNIAKDESSESVKSTNA